MWPGWDAALFRAIHHGWHRAWLDPIMVVLTDPGIWKFPLFALFSLVYLLRGRRGAIALVTLVLTIAASDQLSSHILKPIFRRPRPSMALADTKPLFGVRHSYSFPSTHASNFFSAAPITATLFPRIVVVPFALAAAVSLSRVYVGDHYPIDVAGGTILGLFLGFLGKKAFLRAERTFWRKVRREAEESEAPAEGPIPLAIERGAGEAPSAGP